MKSVPQNQTPVTYEFDNDGWPIDPATGGAFRYSQIIADAAIPLPRGVDTEDPAWRRRQPKPRKASRKASRTTGHTFSAASVLRSLGLSSAETQRRETAAATAELVDRANGNTQHDAILLQLPEGWKVVA